MSSKKQIQHCTLFEIPLFENLGYLLGKILFTEEFTNSRQHTLVKIYDSHSLKPFEIDKISDLDTKELFVYPYLLLGLPKIRGSVKWRVLGQGQFRENDHQIPAFISGYNPVLGRKLNESSEVGIITNLDTKNIRRFPFQKTSHLPYYMMFKSDFITLMLTLEYLRKNNKHLDHNPCEKVFNDFDFKYCKKLVSKYGKYWDIPKEIRGKVAT